MLERIKLGNILREFASKTDTIVGETMLDNYEHDIVAESVQRDTENELPDDQKTIEWLIELLSHNLFINMNDGLGTFIQKTKEGWRICGRDDIIASLNKRVFSDLFTALIVSRCMKKNFDERNKKCKN